MLKKYGQYIQYASSKPLLLILITSLILACSYPIFNIHQDPNGEGWLPKNSKQLLARNQFLKDFGSDELMLLYLTFPDTSTQQYRLNTLESISDKAGSSIYGFSTILSRSSISKVSSIMGKSYSKKMEKLYFASNDTLGEMLFLKVRLNKDIITIRPLLIDSLNTILKAVVPPAVKVHLSGQSIVFNEINNLSSKDSSKLFIICFVLVFILLAWQVRKIKYLLICLALVLAALIPAVSLFGWLNIPFNMITMTVPLLFIINFSSFAIHIITKQTIDIEAYLSKKIPPIITSAIATIIGFGSLAASNITMIAQFGILTSLGIIAGLLTMLLAGVPLAVRLIDINELVIQGGGLSSILDKYYKKISISFSFAALLFILAVIAVAAVVFPKIKTDTNMVNFMKPDNEVRRTVEYIEQHNGPANVIDFLVTKKDKQPLSNEDFKIVSEAKKQAAALPFVKSIVGYDSWRPLIYTVAISDSALAQQLADNFLTKDKRHSRMVINIPSGSVKQMELMLQTIQDKLDKALLGSSLEINPAGFLPVYLEEMDTIVEGMLHGLVIAVILILIVMTLLVRDLKLGLITLLITVFPLCGVAVLMKVFDIPFDVGTSIISSIAIGMITDDALHIIWNYKKHLQVLQDENQLINITFADSVRKIIFPCTATSIMFSIGFAVLLFSNMVTIVEFGMLTTATIILAWISDFILFPAVLKLFYQKKLKS